MNKEISKLSDLSIEEAQQLQNHWNYICICSENDSSIYTVEEFIETKKAIEKFYSNMPPISKDDPDYELKIFAYTYTKLAQTVKYDEAASQACSYSGYALDKSEDLLRKAASAYGGLVLNRSLCSGYSTTLKALLEYQNISAKTISGGPKNRGEARRSEGSSHRWNQVCLDGQWYNCDLTNDADFIIEGLTAPFFLKSNADCDRHIKYPPKNPEMVENCTKSISAEQQETLLNTAKVMIAEEQQRIQSEQAQQNEQDSPSPKSIPHFIASIFRKFFNNQKEAHENER